MACLCVCVCVLFAEVRAQAAAEERARVASITRICRDHDYEAQDLIERGATEADAMKAVLQIDSHLEAQLQDEKFGLSLLKAELESLSQITGSLARSGLEANRRQTPIEGNPLPAQAKPESLELPKNDVPVVRAQETSQTSEPVETDIQSLDRDEAYRSLEKIALRLREMDPHSPAPLLALKAARWGSMNFQEIVQAESKEGVEIANLLSFLGLGKS